MAPTPQMLGWQVILDDLTVMDSRQHQWAEVPDRVLVLKVYYPTKKWIIHNEVAYGEPSTLKCGVDVPDDIFRAALTAAQGLTWPTDSI